MIEIKKGLDIPITGSPEQKIHGKKITDKVAILGSDFNGMKPTMLVKEGDRVKKGQVLFKDKKNLGVLFTSPVSGVIESINRGARRIFESVVIKKDQQADDQISFQSFKSQSPQAWSRQEIVNLLVESGEWTAFKTRPFSKNPTIDSKPHALFINAMDTKPLAPKPGVWVSKHRDSFTSGVKILSKLTEGMTFVCLSRDNNLKLSLEEVEIKVVEFSGPHPAGNTGTHIHFLSPASAQRTVWSINYQDVIAIGKLFETGEVFTQRMISLAGPEVIRPRLVQTERGAQVSGIAFGEFSSPLKNTRLISGSVLGGRTARDAFDYLGRFHHQVSVLEEQKEREFLGWQSPGFDKYSVTRAFLSKLIPGKTFHFTTSTHGSLRAIVPIGSYEKVMPLDIQPTYLLRSLMAADTDMAQKLGILELEEEDLSLCSFVDPSKHEFGSILRKNLEKIEKDG